MTVTLSESMYSQVGAGVSKLFHVSTHARNGMSPVLRKMGRDFDILSVERRGDHPSEKDGLV